MQKLLYHPKKSEDEESVFDKAISEICTDNAIKLVSPYMGINYIQRITALSVEWKLISDVNEWLSSSSSSDRLKIADFIESNLEKIHHYNDLHAKVVIGQDRAYLGSANLTSSGLLRRTEMGILIDDEALLQELNAWFDENWLDTAPPDLQEVAEFIQSNNQIEDLPEKKVNNKIIQSKGTVIRKKLHPLGNGSVAKNCEKVIENKKDQPPEMNVNLFLSNVLNKLREKDFPISDFYLRSEFCNSGFSRHQISDGLSFFTANNPRTVFSLKTINRIIYHNQQFLPSSSPLLENTIEKYDKYLAGIIKNVHLDEGFFFLKNRDFIELIGISSSEDELLINSLIESGFIVDNGGGAFILSEDFDWSSRFKLFRRAFSAWNDILSQQRLEAAIFTEKTLSSQLNVFAQTKPTCTPARQYDAKNIDQKFIDELLIFGSEFDKFFELFESRKNDKLSDFFSFYICYLPVLLKAQELFFIELFKILSKEHVFLRQSSSLENLIDRVVDLIDDSEIDDPEIVDPEYYEDTGLSFWGKKFFGMILIENVFKNEEFCGLHKLFYVSLTYDLKGGIEYEINFHRDFSGMKKELPLLYKFLDDSVKSKSGSVYEYIGGAWVDYLSADALTERILVDFEKIIIKNGDIHHARAIETVCTQIPYSFSYKIIASGMKVTTRAEWHKCREYLEKLSKQLDNTGRPSMQAKKSLKALKAWDAIQVRANKVRADFYAAKKIAT